MNISCARGMVRGWLFLFLAFSAGFAAPDDAWLAPKALQSLLLDIATAGPRLVAVGERGHILLSDDQGQHWRQVPVPANRLLTAVYFVDDKRGWAVGHEALVLATTDGGEHWQIQHDGFAGSEPALLDVWFADASTGWAVGSFGEALRTTDGGAHWQDWTDHLDNPDGLHLNAITGLPDGRLLVAGERGLLRVSSDAGNRWQAVPFPYDGSLFGVLADATHVWVFGLRGHVYASDQRLADWQQLSSGNDQTLFGGVVSRDGVITLVGQAGTVLAGRFGQDALTVVQSEQGQHLSGVTVSDGACWAVGQGGVHALGRVQP